MKTKQSEKGKKENQDQIPEDQDPKEDTQLDDIQLDDMQTDDIDYNQIKHQIEFNEGILYNPKLIYHNIAIKLKILSRRDKILQIKLSNYQKKHEHLNMAIIIVSSVLGIYETFRAKIDNIIKSHPIDITVNLIPIFLSGIITCTASIIKLKKYQEKSDNIHLTREKVSVARVNLKTVQEHLMFCKSPEELIKIKKIYLNSAFNSYCDGNAYLDKYLKEIDYFKYKDKLTHEKEFYKCQDLKYEKEYYKSHTNANTNANTNAKFRKTTSDIESNIRKDKTPRTNKTQRDETPSDDESINV